MAQNQVFRGTARKTLRYGNRTEFMYHNTAVVTVTLEGYVILNSGGYRTATTKLAMNQVSNQYGYGFQVWQHKGEWFVDVGRLTFEFTDGMRFAVAEARARAA